MPVEHYENFPVASLLCAPRCAADRSDLRFARPPTTSPTRRRDASGAARGARAYREALAATPRVDRPPAGPQCLHAGCAGDRAASLPGALLDALLDASSGRDRPPLRRSPGAARLLPRSANRSAACCCTSTASTAPTTWPAPMRSAPPCSSPLLAGPGPRHRARPPVPARHRCRRHGVEPLDVLAGKTARRCIASCSMSSPGAPAVCGSVRSGVHAVPGRAGWELRLVVQALAAVLERTHGSTARPGPSAEARAADAPAIVWRALRMRRSGRAERSARMIAAPVHPVAAR